MTTIKEDLAIFYHQMIKIQANLKTLNKIIKKLIKRIYPIIISFKIVKQEEKA